MQSFVKIRPSRYGKITLSFIDIGKSCLSREFFQITNMSFNAIRENKILAEIFESTVPKFHPLVLLISLLLITDCADALRTSQQFLSQVGTFAVLSQYSKTCIKRSLKNRQNKDLDNNWYLNECQKYCRMHHLEHSAILLTCIYRQFFNFLEWPFYTGFTVSKQTQGYHTVPPVRLEPEIHRSQVEHSTSGPLHFSGLTTTLNEYSFLLYNL